MRLDQRKRDPPIEQLSKRERELIAAMLAGHVTARQIAAHMVISERTVNAHLRSIFKIAGVHNKASLMLWILASGNH